MDWKEVVDYYSRIEIQKAILLSAKDREVAVRVGDSFAKRPDILQFPGDVKDWARKGATSFHISEERWRDPLSLETGLVKKQMDSLRIGWDLVIDIDSPYWDFAKQTASFVVELLRDLHSISCVGVKFSGNKGFHISVPFEAFPQEIDGIAIKDYFPDGLKRIAFYLQDRIVEHWKTNLLSKINPKVLMQIVEQAGKQMSDIMTNGEIDVLKFIEIDTVLISSRHMFRAPYSLHEKSGLASIPINPDEIVFFDKSKAKPANVKADMKFILRDTAKPNEASSLIMQAFDWFKKSKKEVRQEEDTKTRIENSKYDNELPKEKIPEEYFPPCIKKILEGKLDDGKKRALFLVLKFLIHTGWNWADIEARLVEWNKTHSTPLRDNYIQEQITWHKKQKTVVLPPNCDKQEYYKELQFCSPLPLCSKIRNPVNFAKIKASRKDYGQKKWEENKPKAAKTKAPKKKSKLVKEKSAGDSSI
ncbi:MAG: DNA primase small subunit domain-containing protein [Candidatus Nanoarchaeia archaeon]|nr:DNA primase small subunit domain-containing protein [Candidatus Nanoarchaeia archaeon]